MRMKNSLENIRQFAVYVVVGGIATIVEWAAFWAFNHYMHYFLATTLAFALSTLANWWAGRLLLFKTGHKKLSKELTQIYITSILGLLFNFVIMWVAIEHLGIPEMASKMIATGIVFFWNFLVRKVLIYKI